MAIGGAFVAVGTVLLILAVTGWRKRQAFLASALTATGRIVDYESVRSFAGSGSGGTGKANSAGLRATSGSRMIVEFETPGKQAIRFRSRLGPTDVARTEVEVLYLPQDPAGTAQIRNWFEQTGWVVIVGGLALASVCTGAAFVLAGCDRS